LFTTRPTTLLGLAALLMYITSEAHEICREEDGQTVIEFTRGWVNDTELLDALERFHELVTDAFQAITAGGARG
jgi:flagellar biosynthesis regulator FlbT